MKENDLLSRLSNDKRITLSLEKLEALVKQGESRLGASNDQVTHFVKKADSWGNKYPDARNYRPPSIL